MPNSIKMLSIPKEYRSQRVRVYGIRANAHIPNGKLFQLILVMVIFGGFRYVVTKYGANFWDSADNLRDTGIEFVNNFISLYKGLSTPLDWANQIINFVMDIIWNGVIKRISDGIGAIGQFIQWIYNGILRIIEWLPL